MGNKPKHKLKATGPANVPGLAYNAEEGALTFSVGNLPATSHFFAATDFQTVIQNGQLHVLFGSRSALDSKEQYRLAVEVVMPIKSAQVCLVKTIWEKPDMNGRKPFIESIKNEIASWPDAYKEDRKLGGACELPTEPNNFRPFAANFATSTTSIGQVMVDFFEASPDVVVGLLQGAFRRRDAQVRSIVGVIMSPLVALRFYENVQQLVSKIKLPEAKDD